MENLGEALGLLLIGMILVIIVLWLVVQLGTLLIKLTNRYIRDEEPNGNINQGTRLHTRKIAAITAAVDVITLGQGRVGSIQKK